MTTTQTHEDRAARQAFIDATEEKVERWSSYVDTLLQAFGRTDNPPAGLGPKMEALRNKRDTVVTKVHALKRHKVHGWTEARQELAVTWQELRGAWRTVVNTLADESLFS